MRRFPLVLYKKILRLHKGLPDDMRFIGDQYVKDEFRRHKAADAAQARIFFDEWTQYCVDLSKQLSQQGIVRGFLGRNLTEENLESFADEQLHQLLELKLEAEKPKNSADQ